MLLNTHSWFSLNHGVLSPEQVLQEAHDLGLQQVALTDINSTAGWSDFFRLSDKYKVRPLAGIEFKLGTRTLYIGIARNEQGVHQLASLLSDGLLDGETLPEQAPELPDAFIIYPYGSSNIPTKLRQNEFIGIRPGDVNRLRFSSLMKHKDRLLAMAPATFRSDPQLAKRDFNVHRLKRAVDTNTLLSTTPPEHVAAPQQCFLNEEQLCTAFADVPELVWNTRRLMDQCDVHFAHGKSKNRRLWSADPGSDLELLRRETYAGLQRRYSATSAGTGAMLTQKVLDRVERELTVIAQKDFVSYFLINWDLIRFAKHKGFFHVGRGSGANSLVAYCLGITDVDPIELDLYFERFINPSRSNPPDFDLDFSWKDRDQVTKYLFDTYGAQRRVALLATYSTYQYRAVIRELGKVFGLPPSEIDALAEGDSGHSKWIGRHENAGPASTSGSISGSGQGGLGRMSQNDRVAKSILRYSTYLHEHPHHLSIHVGGVLISEKPLTYYTALHLPPKGFATTQFSMLEAEDLGLHKFDILSQRGLGHIRDTVEMVERRSEDKKIRRSENEECALISMACEPAALALAPSQRTCTVDPMGRHTELDIHAIEKFKHDPRIKELLRTGDTIGCFYVESPAMRMLLKKLSVEDYPTLVAASSIIRPGVAQSGMMREYILRHRHPERRKQAHPAMLKIMPDTYGVMVYQEDVIKVAHLYAGLTLAEADILRRGMSGKYRSRQEFQRVKERFFNNCVTKGYPANESAEIWRQIESFAGYSFAKGHSASYAVESYQSLYLKAYYPLEFMVAVANNFGGFYHTEFYLHEARRAGAVIEAPCVNRSEELCSLLRVGSDESLVGSSEYRVASGEWRVGSDESVVVSGQSLVGSSECSVFSGQSLVAGEPKLRSATSRSQLLFLGLQNIKSLDNATMERILRERGRNGPFTDLPDLLKRVPIAVEQARILIRVGAFRFTGKSKPELLWDLTLLHPGSKVQEHVPDLFVSRPPANKLPQLQHFDLSDAYDELELLGFPLCDPFLLVEQGPEDQRLNSSAALRAGSGNAGANTLPHILARDMPRYIGRRVTMLGYVVHIKPTKTGKGERMSFGSFIDTVGDFWDSAQFPSVEAQYPFRGRGVYRLTGKVEEEFGHYSLSVQHVEKLPWKQDPRYGSN